MYIEFDATDRNKLFTSNLNFAVTLFKPFLDWLSIRTSYQHRFNIC